MNEKCRLCGENAKELLNVFKENDFLPNLKLRINLNLQITISPSDRFSHSICQSCFKKLQDLDKFIKDCQNNQFALLDIKDTVSLEKQTVVSCISDERIPVVMDNAASKISYSLIQTMKCDKLENNKTEAISNKRKSSNSMEESFSSSEETDYVDNIVVDENVGGQIVGIAENHLIDLDNPGSRVSVFPKQIPFSKLVSFFSSKIRINKSISSNRNLIDEQNFRNIRNLCNATHSDDLKKSDHIDNGEIEKIKIKFEENSKEIEVCDGSSSVEDTCKLNMKCKEELLTRTNFKKFKSCTKFSKMKEQTLKSCPICAHQFPLNEIEDHIKFHSDDEEYLNLIISEMKEVPFKHKAHYCEECKKVFVRDSLYMEHMKEHAKIKMINCHLCDHTFSLRKKLKVHLRAVHIPKNSKCDQCSYAAKTLTDLQKHKKGVHEHQPIICEICGKSVSSNVSNYNRHLQTHSEERPYKCELCNACYKTAASLQKHRDNIHFPKSVMCTACGTICGSKIKYKKHLRRCRKRMLRFN